MQLLTTQQDIFQPLLNDFSEFALLCQNIFLSLVG